MILEESGAKWSTEGGNVARSSEGVRGVGVARRDADPRDLQAQTVMPAPRQQCRGSLTTHVATVGDDCSASRTTEVLRQQRCVVVAEAGPEHAVLQTQGRAANGSTARTITKTQADTFGNRTIVRLRTCFWFFHLNCMPSQCWGKEELCKSAGGKSLGRVDTVCLGVGPSTKTVAFVLIHRSGQFPVFSCSRC
jgi:hypothetical protein